MRQQAARAEADLRSGQFEATIDYGNNTRSTVRVRFDYGDGQRARRLHIATTAENAGGSRATEYLLIGDRSWQRQGAGGWAPANLQDGMWEQVQVLLPRVGAAGDVALVDAAGADGAVLRWHDAASNADSTLEIDLATGTPRQLRQAQRANRVVLAVAYREWNSPVDIAAPGGQ